VSVILERRGESLQLIIEDDGAGFEREGGSRDGMRLGITGMQERAGLLGGSVTVESSPGHGTTVYARVPLVSEVSEHETITPAARR
jgi:signal transduction histidine kinase